MGVGPRGIFWKGYIFPKSLVTGPALEKKMLDVKCFVASFYNMEKAFSPAKSLITHINNGNELTRNQFICAL